MKPKGTPGAVPAMTGLPVRRRMHAPFTVAAASVLLAGALAACGPPPADNRSQTGTPTPGCHVTDQPRPGRDDEVAVLDLGFTVDRDNRGRPQVSYGAVLINRSADLVAGRLDLRVRMRETSGHLLRFRGHLDAEPVTETVHSGWVRPGERVGIGGHVYLAPTSARQLPQPTVDVEVTNGSWFSSCAFVMQRLGVGAVETFRKGGTAVVRFNADVPACYESDLTSDFAKLHAVYYNGAGSIVGGAALDVQDHELAHEESDHPGRVTATGRMPAAANPQGTKVYALGGCGGAPGTTPT